MKFGEVIHYPSTNLEGWSGVGIGVSLDFDWKSRHERYFSIDKQLCVNDVLAEDWQVDWNAGPGAVVGNDVVVHNATL